MDPEVALKNARAAAEEIREIEQRGDVSSMIEDELDAATARLVESFMALDEWISEGGFLPKDWSNRPAAGKFIVIAREHVGSRWIKAWDRMWDLVQVLGVVQERDIGKRVYCVGNGADGFILQVENDEQLDERLGRK